MPALVTGLHTTTELLANNMTAMIRSVAIILLKLSFDVENLTIYAIVHNFYS